MQALRGATTAAGNTAAAILQATRELLLAMASENELTAEEIVSIIFTATPDLTAAFPARAARELGWTGVALLDAVEMDVPGALPQAIRVLLLVERPHDPQTARHVYLGQAASLRPDLNIAERHHESQIK